MPYSSSIVSLGRGARYPLPIAAFEGAVADFLHGNGNILQIAMPNLAKSEINSIRRDPMKAGIIQDGPFILWVFVFGTIILECPFDVRLIPKDMLTLPQLETDKTRMTVEIHLVDTATTTLAGLRQVTLSPSLTRKFFAAVQEQIVDRREAGVIESRYASMPIMRLPMLANVERCGT